jgi:chemotaxis protein MotB
VFGALVLAAGGAYGARLVLERVGSEEPRGPTAAESAQRATVAESHAMALETELVQARAALAAAAERDEQLEAAKLQVETKAAAAAGALESKLVGAVGAQADVTTEGDEVRLQLVDKVLFQLGSATLTPRGEAVLDKLGAALNEVPDKQIWVQGHTDTSPIRFKDGVSTTFDSNWELSAARALTVVHYLEDNVGVDPKRLAAVAFGEHRPAARTKAKNRRIEIVLYPRHAIAQK